MTTCSVPLPRLYGCHVLGPVAAIREACVGRKVCEYTPNAHAPELPSQCASLGDKAALGAMVVITCGPPRRMWAHSALPLSAAEHALRLDHSFFGGTFSLQLGTPDPASEVVTQAAPLVVDSPPLDHAAVISGVKFNATVRLWRDTVATGRDVRDQDPQVRRTRLCPLCDGRGANETDMIQCPVCHGHGVRRWRADGRDACPARDHAAGRQGCPYARTLSQRCTACSVRGTNAQRAPPSHAGLDGGARRDWASTCRSPRCAPAARAPVASRRTSRSSLWSARASRRAPVSS